jgi:hypothetical protein
MIDFTQIPNELLRPSSLTIQARYLLCVLLRHCRNTGVCFPGQETLGKTLGLSVRQVSDYVNELIEKGYIVKTRTGFNTSNTYTVIRHFKEDTKSSSGHTRNTVPYSYRTTFPPTNTNLLTKENNIYNKAGLQKLRDVLVTKGLKHNLHAIRDREATCGPYSSSLENQPRKNSIGSDSKIDGHRAV